MSRPRLKDSVKLNLSVDVRTYRALEALGAVQKVSKSRVVDVLVDIAYQAACGPDCPAPDAVAVAVSAAGLAWRSSVSNFSTTSPLPPLPPHSKSQPREATDHQ